MAQAPDEAPPVPLGKKLRRWNRFVPHLLVLGLIIAKVSEFFIHFSATHDLALLRLPLWWLACLIPLAFRRSFPLDVLVVTVWISLALGAIADVGDVSFGDFLTDDLTGFVLVSTTIAAYTAARLCGRLTVVSGLLAITVVFLLVSAFRMNDAPLSIIICVWLAAAAGLATHRPDPATRLSPARTRWTVPAPSPSPISDKEIGGITRILRGESFTEVARSIGTEPRELFTKVRTLVDHHRRDVAAPDGRAASPLSNFLGHLPAIVAALGLVLYVPTYLAYEDFYGALGVAPDEVGLGYATILSREITWLVYASLTIVAFVALIVFCAILAFRPALLERRWPQHTLTASGPLRRAAALLAVTALAIALSITGYQLLSVPTISGGSPVRPDSDSFFKARATVAEITWIDKAPPGGTVPNRMLFLGQANGVAVFWDPVSERAVRLPSGSIAVTPISDQLVHFAETREDGRILVNPDDSGQTVFPLKLAGIADPQRDDEPGCSSAAWNTAVWKVVSGRSFVATRMTSTEGAYLFRLPDYVLINAELLKRGAKASPLGPTPAPSIKDEMARAQSEAATGRLVLPPPCKAPI
jgi:hypothetical protein